MVHSHPVNDTDKHFFIDPITRSVTNVEMKKTILMQHDHNSERFTFEIDRFVEDHDLMLCNKVEVHYSNIDSTKKNRNLGVYEVDDLKIATDDDSKLTFSWLVSENATIHNGSLSFLILFACVESGETVYRWHTDINSSISISKGMNNDSSIEEAYPDILTQWKNELFNAVYGYKSLHVGPTEPDIYPYIWFDTSEYIGNNDPYIGKITIKDVDGNVKVIHPFTLLAATDQSDIATNLENQNERLDAIEKSFENLESELDDKLDEVVKTVSADIDNSIEEVSTSFNSRITQESSARAQADNDLENAIQAEQNARVAADNTKQSKLVMSTVTLSASAWSNNTQTVSVTAVTSSNNVSVSPNPDSIKNWSKAFVYLSSQANGSLTFTCEKTPTAALNVNIITWE